MDMITMAYYGVICALLALFSAKTRHAGVRLATGFVVGLVAASLLPVLKGALGI